MATSNGVTDANAVLPLSSGITNMDMCNGGGGPSEEPLQPNKKSSTKAARALTRGKDCLPLQSLLSDRVLSQLRGGTSFFASYMDLTRNYPGVVNLALGAPDFEGSAVARQAAADVVSASNAGPGANNPALVNLNQYSPTPGIPRLKIALSSFYKKQFNAEYDPEKEILITTGGTEAVCSTFFAILNPGEKVVVPQPAWPWYVPIIRLAGGVPVPFNLKAPNYTIDLGELREVVERESPKVLVLNTPHNPTGHALTREELEGVAQICVGHGILVVFDEVYQHIVFPPALHLRVSSFPGMRERTISIGSGGKLFGLTGWRVGWALGPDELIRGINVIHQHSTVCAPVPLQHGIAAALDAEDGGFDGIPKLYQGNYKILKEAFETIPGVRVCPSDGGYFFTLDIATTNMDEEEFFTSMLKEARVGIVPMRPFYVSDSNSNSNSKSNDDIPKHLIRVSVCPQRSQVESAAKRILEYSSAAKSREEEIK